MMRKSALALLLGALLALPLAAQERSGSRPGAPGEADPFARFFFPPELVMQHQGEIGLQDAQRATLQQAMQQAQGTFTDLQWKLSGEGEKLSRLLQSSTVGEAQVLEQVDRILALEREMKRAQIALLVRIKNALTPAQQEKLAALRGGR